MSVVLAVEDLCAGFGARPVLHEVCLTVRSGEVAGVFGLNGAGKSVLLKVIAGLVPVWSGRIVFDGLDITSLPAEARVALGMGHVPQGRQVFGALTVAENLRLGAYTTRRRNRAAYRVRLEEVLDQFPALRKRLHQPSGTLSGGEQASLAVARALMSAPRLMLVDEPSAGLSPAAAEDLREMLGRVAASGVAMVLVEQNVRFGLSLAAWTHLLEGGRVVHRAEAADVDESVLARHLGIGAVTWGGRFGHHEKEVAP